MTDRKEKAYEHLLLVAKRVERQFSNGNHPSFEQIENLRGAIEALEFQLICGHPVVDDCDCIELNRIL